MGVVGAGPGMVANQRGLIIGTAALDRIPCSRYLFVPGIQDRFDLARVELKAVQNRKVQRLEPGFPRIYQDRTPPLHKSGQQASERNRQGNPRSIRVTEQLMEFGSGFGSVRNQAHGAWPAGR